MESLNSRTINSLLEIFNQIYSHDNLLILDTKMSPIINYLIPFKEFRERANFDKVILSDNLNSEILQLYQNIILLFDEDTEILLPEHSRVTLIIKNLSKLRLYELNQQYNLNVNFSTIINSPLQSVRAKGVRIFNWKFNGLMIDGVITLQDGLSNYFNQPIYQINQLANCLIHLVDAYNVKVNNSYIQGPHGTIFKKYFDNKLHEHLNRKYNSLQQEFYLNNLRGTHNLVVIERNLDFLPIIMNQLNYLGLMNDMLDVKINLVKILADHQKYEQLKIEDELFDKLKYLNFSLVGPKLNKLAKWIKNQYSSNNPETGSISEIKNLVSNLSDLNRQQDLVKKHTNISEALLTKVKSGGESKYNEYELLLEFQNEVFQMSYKQHIARILELLQLNLSDKAIINSITIVSILNNGIRSKDLDTIKSQAFENFGIEFIFKLDKLFKWKLIKLSDSELFDTPIDGVSGGMAVQLNNYTLLSKFWNLHPEDDEEEVEINSVLDYQHPSFALPSGTVPLTVRLIESLFSRHFLTYKPINKITKQPSWENLSLDKMFYGNTTEQVTSASCDKTILVFIGGITWSEVACIKYLSEKVKHEFVIVSNGVVGNNDFMKCLDV